MLMEIRKVDLIVNPLEMIWMWKN